MQNVTETTERRSKRRPVAAFALAALAVGGLGAALTSAAWTDNVFFSASAEAATFDIQGSLDGKTWLDSSDEGAIELVVPAAENLLPGQTRDVTLHVQNLGSVPAAVVSSVTAAASNEISGITVELIGAPTTLDAASGDVSFTLRLSTPDKWDASNQGKSGSFVVSLAATATAP